MSLTERRLARRFSSVGSIEICLQRPIWVGDSSPEESAMLGFTFEMP
jgi:hypothetical protein